MTKPIMRTRASEVKLAVSPSLFYARELEMVSGRGLWRQARCPFHAPDRHPSFAFNVETGAYRCFACGAHGGDAIDFVKQRYSLSFRDSMDLLRREGWCA
jgi:DNA primase